MSEPPQDPGRRSLPHLPSRELANQATIQFISCNVAHRRPLFARPKIHQLLLEAWKKADHWLVGRYVIMPDHIHLFCAPQRVPMTSLKRWKEFWQAEATRHWPYQGELNIFQWREQA